MSIFIPLALVPFAMAAPGTLQVLPPAGSNLNPQGRGITIRSVFAENGRAAVSFSMNRREDYIRLNLPQSVNVTGYEGMMFTVRNDGDRACSVEFSLRGQNAQNREGMMAAFHTIPPGAKKTLLYWFNGYDAPFRIQYALPNLNVPFCHSWGWNADFNPANVQVLQFWNLANAPANLTLTDVTMVNKRTDYTGLVDQFGQWAPFDYAGKIDSPQDLAARNVTEQTELSNTTNVGNLNGIDALPTTRATGRWRIERAPNGNQFFVTPQGKRFWVMGLNQVVIADGAVIEGREQMFPPMPDKNGPQGQFWFQAPNRFEGWKWCYNFYRQNLTYKYGPNFQSAWSDRTLDRIGKMGFNTTLAQNADSIIGSNVPNIWMQWLWDCPFKLPTPWVFHINPPDPFNPQFETWVTNYYRPHIARINASANVIGFHSDNEISWGLRGNNHLQWSIPIGAINADPSQPAKQAMITMLQNRYRNDIGALNRSWNTNYANWAALSPANAWGWRALTPGMTQDFRTYLRSFADRYYSTVRRVLTNLGMNKLYLGSRDAYQCTPREVWEAQARYVDAISINLYTEDDAAWNEVNSLSKPVLITEFCYTATDRGHWTADTTIQCGSQTERAARTRAYVERAARSRNILGASWWRYIDNPPTGRWSDDERWNVGVVDITDNPYNELINSFRTVSSNIATLRPVR